MTQGQNKPLIIINPNSSQIVTAGIDRAVAGLHAMGRGIRCETLHKGPPGIEDQRQADLVVAPLLDLAARLESEASGFLIACFGDPGLHALRCQSALPVFGIQECAVLSAMMAGQRFGVISILAPSVPRHMRAFAAMGVAQRCAGDRALGLGVADLAREDVTFGRLYEVGAALRDQDGAEVLILGCAGMAGYRARLELDLNVPVIDPCQAGAAMALGQIALHESNEA